MTRAGLGHGEDLPDDRRAAARRGAHAGGRRCRGLRGTFAEHTPRTAFASGLNGALKAMGGAAVVAGALVLVLGAGASVSKRSNEIRPAGADFGGGVGTRA
ncbi:hypothetical protein ABZ357_17220 [Streptomyces sp. NPDC005917]|uniref:hypothetical protein n=1 Tax=unclassified Streptomyces TaxID=2593676 RepID=UPI0034010DCD